MMMYESDWAKGGSLAGKVCDGPDRGFSIAGMLTSWRSGLSAVDYHGIFRIRGGLTNPHKLIIRERVLRQIWNTWWVHTTI